MTSSYSQFPSLWNDSTLRTYLGEIHRRHGIVDTLALPNMRDLPPVRIENLFVQPLLSEVPVSPLSSPETWPTGQTLFDAFESSRCLVLLGDPGSGKTTLANWLAWRLTAGLTSPLPAVFEDRLPIPCVLREMKKATFSANTTIADLAVQVAENLLGKRIGTGLKASLRARVEAKQYVLILDGVDEIPNVQRSTVAKWLQQATADGACAMATSRIVGYEDLPVDKPTPHQIGSRSSKERGATVALFSVDMPAPEILDVEASINLSKTEMRPSPVSVYRETRSWAQIQYLMPFDKMRISAFVENWYLQRSGTEHEAKQRAEDLMFALGQSEVTEELARTPNLLSLMAIVHRERAHLPDGKALLYKEIANAYINTIDQHRKIFAGDALAPYGWEIRENWLAYVGFQMQLRRSSETNAQSDSGVLVSEENVTTWLTEAMTVSGVSQAQLNAKTFLEWVARRSGLLLPRGEGLFAFVHLSFQEYFCARYLAGRIMSPSFIKDRLGKDARVTKEKLRSWSGSSNWRESFIYLLELISGERDVDWVEDLVEILFGDLDSIDGLGSEETELAARILSNRHIHLGNASRMSLARGCSAAAYSEWTYPWIGSEMYVLRTLLRNGYAAIFSDAQENSLARQRELPFRKPSELQKMSGDKNLCLVIVNDEGLTDVDAFKGMTNLSHLIIEKASITDIAPLSGLKRLKTVNLVSLDIDDISPLGDLRDLRELDLSGTGISDISSLNGLRQLEALDVSKTEIDDISVVSKMRRLSKLRLSETNVRDLSPISKLKHLEDLGLFDTPISDLSPLRAVRTLRYLSIVRTEVEDISSLKGMKSLRFLTMDGSNVKDISVLAYLSSMSYLSFSSTEVVDISILSRLKELTHLSFYSTSVDDISALKNLKRLINLDLSSTPVFDISPISNLSRLYDLDLSSTALVDISPLAGLTRLARLNLSDTGIHDIDALSTLQGLDQLKLESTGVTDLTPILKLPNLRSLILDGSSIRDVSPLAKMESLTFLSIKNTNVTDVSALSNLPRLRIEWGS